MGILHCIILGCSVAVANPSDICCRQDTLAVRPLQLTLQNSNASIGGSEESGDVAGEESERTAVGGQQSSRLPVPGQENTNIYATFPGGNAALRRYIRENRRYPEECREERLCGEAVIAITVMPDGCITSVTIAESSGNRYMDKEALRIVAGFPQWEPARDMDNAESKEHLIRIKFRPGR
ncbi:MAG: energy transducer TonB [Bacteroidales bacterium]|nr:energy transducer TonB [Bacteroidales bacterium]